tara:strand:- start:250 stop:834 length:585 start_codon:yes stop_codon:yes gene_type:complete
VVKFKLDIEKANLSWEKKIIKICDSENCNEKGEYRAPKSRIRLNEYFYFCLKHIKEYNKSWDFYKGLTVNQIELSMRKDTVWDRPSWPLKGDPNKVLDQINEFISNDYNLFKKDKDFREFDKNRLEDVSLTPEQNKALQLFGLKLPVNLEELKKKYKKLVKIFHPDVNDNNKEAENKFKEINESYKLLLKKFTK